MPTTTRVHNFSSGPAVLPLPVLEEAQRDLLSLPGVGMSVTPREVEVLRLIAEGLTNTEIAERLVVSAATVKSHVNHIFAKAGVRDRAQAVVYAYSRGLA